MKTLDVNYCKGLVADIHQLEEILKKQPEHQVDSISWAEFPYRPKVSFKIAYSDEALLLSFTVEEAALRINNFKSNDPVYEDSCVEFFLSFSDQKYYNLEFNAIGVGLIGYGTNDKKTRKRLSNERILQVKTFSKITKNNGEKDVKWNLTLFIPLTIFSEEKIVSLKGQAYRANFYKCGDLLPVPHFVSWSPIQAKEPNFHLPDYFGEIRF